METEMLLYLFFELSSTGMCFRLGRRMVFYPIKKDEDRF